uniref:Reverse transcriptase domain-containing protein n=1 Tax=Arundo donax TaxID=35708 RepID=A0A0A9AYG2_ARUDO
MSFWRIDHRVQWHGVGTSRSAQVLSISNDNLLQLLAEFADIFAEPQGLPPAPFDHRIHLVPGTPPVAVWPYRYPQLLKDEIERQCEVMLQQGIIQPSTSPFSSPVLLVRKKDGTWRFCVN